MATRAESFRVQVLRSTCNVREHLVSISCHCAGLAIPVLRYTSSDRARCRVLPAERQIEPTRDASPASLLSNQRTDVERGLETAENPADLCADNSRSQPQRWAPSFLPTSPSATSTRRSRRLRDAEKSAERSHLKRCNPIAALRGAPNIAARLNGLAKAVYARQRHVVDFMDRLPRMFWLRIPPADSRKPRVTIS
jgi:hypothetical protein